MTIIIENATLIYPAIYEANTPCFSKSEPRFATVFDYKGEALKETKYEPRNKDGLYCTNSKFAPEICSTRASSNYRIMTEAYNIAKARNIPLNHLFYNLDVYLEVRIFNYNNKYGCGTGASIVRLWVNENQLRNNALTTIKKDAA